MHLRGTILVVDDDEAIRESLSDCLRDEGFEVVCARNGAEALASLEAMESPIVILLDLMMPVMSGWEFLEVVQASDRLSAIPIIVVSAMCAPGARACIEKPVDLDRLLEAVHSLATPRPRSPTAQDAKTP